MTTDGKRLYNQHTDSVGLKLFIFGIVDTPESVIQALDIETGSVLWTRLEPNLADIDATFAQKVHSTFYGPLTAANGVIYAASLGNSLMALDAKDGTILFRFPIEGAGFAPPAINKGVIYWPTGYGDGRFLGTRTVPDQDPPDTYSPHDNKVYAFEVPDDRFQQCVKNKKQKCVNKRIDRCKKLDTVCQKKIRKQCRKKARKQCRD